MEKEISKIKEVITSVMAVEPKGEKAQYFGSNCIAALFMAVDYLTAYAKENSNSADSAVNS